MHPSSAEQTDRAPARPIDFTRATILTTDVMEQILDAFEYHPWNEEQIRRGKAVRYALTNAFAAIVENVPPGPDRTVALRKLREARMDANSALTHMGKY